MELVNFDRSVWLDDSRSGSLVAARSQPLVFPGLLNWGDLALQNKLLFAQ